MAIDQSPDDTDEYRAITALAEWYAVQHIIQQESIAGKVAAGLGLLWPILQFNKLDDTTTTWLHAVTLQIENAFDDSAAAAFQYVQAAKWSVEPDSDPLSQVDVSLPVQDVQTAMKVTGPIQVKSRMPAPESEAMDSGEKGSTGAGITQAMNGGRSQVLAQVRADAAGRKRAGKVIGYARVTDSNPCYFCALLASQGAVYLTENAFNRSSNAVREVKWTSNNDKGTWRKFLGDGPAKVHDNCKCTMRPVYSESDSMDERAKYFLDQWKTHGKSSGGRSALQNYRNNYVPPPPYSAELDSTERTQIAADVQHNRDLLISRGFEATSPNVKFLDDSIKKLSLAA